MINKISLISYYLYYNIIFTKHIIKHDRNLTLSLIFKIGIKQSRRGNHLTITDINRFLSFV